jgi:hypothetical protein
MTTIEITKQYLAESIKDCAGVICTMNCLVAKALNDKLPEGFYSEISNDTYTLYDLTHSFIGEWPLSSQGQVLVELFDESDWVALDRELPCLVVLDEPVAEEFFVSPTKGQLQPVG